MRLVFHGGLCCGVKTIYGMGMDPDELLPEKLAATPRNHDRCGDHVHSELSFFTDAAPEETYLERLDRLLAFVDAHRPYGIVEIILAESEDEDCNQMPVWKDHLLARGFKIVNSCYNSNSGNRIYVFHRTISKLYSKED